MICSGMTAVVGTDYCRKRPKKRLDAVCLFKFRTVAQDQVRITEYLSFEGWKDDHEEAKFPQIKGVRLAHAANSSSAQQRGCRDVLWEILSQG